MSTQCARQYYSMYITFFTTIMQFTTSQYGLWTVVKCKNHKFIPSHCRGWKNEKIKFTFRCFTSFGLSLSGMASNNFVYLLQNEFRYLENVRTASLHMKYRHYVRKMIVIGIHPAYFCSRGQIRL